MAVVTARMGNPQRARENSSVERALAPVTATVTDPVEHWINTAETRAEVRDAELHRNNANVSMVLTRSHSAEPENEAEQAQMSGPDPREQLQMNDGV